MTSFSNAALAVETVREFNPTSQASLESMADSRPLADLCAMLTTCRPYGSKTEKRFIRDWLEPLGVERDGIGNVYKRIGDAPVLWSCHTDTVHRVGGKQHIRFDSDGAIRLSAKSRSRCLGADCTTGAWIMREMILANRPGLYVFHRGEECGGIGSSHIANKTPALLDGIQYAIAFDRYGYGNVITHQFGRCCSTAFADALADRLNGLDRTFDYRPDDSGVFTDTANYTSDIPECTNISVGYFNHHTESETQDSDFALRLRSVMLALDVTGLPVARAPGEDDYSREYKPMRRASLAWDWNDDSFESNVRMGVSDYIKDRFDRNEALWGNEAGGPTFDLAELTREYPDEAADLLESLGVSGADLAEYVYEKTGRVRF
jgi:hypothetical protein